LKHFVKIKGISVAFILYSHDSSMISHNFSSLLMLLIKLYHMTVNKRQKKQIYTFTSFAALYNLF